MVISIAADVALTYFRHIDVGCARYRLSSLAAGRREFVTVSEFVSGIYWLTSAKLSTYSHQGSL